MNKVKILHCADLHIGASESFLGINAASRQYENLLTFEKIIDTAKENQVQVVAVAGDLFHSNDISQEFVTPVLEKIKSVPEIKVVFAAGNHDPLNSASPFKNNPIPENLFILDTKDCVTEFKDIGLRVYGRSFESVYMKGEESFSIIPPDDGIINLMVLHGELRSDLNSQYNSVTPKFVLNSRMDYIALGHVHTHMPVSKLGTVSFAYCGCPEGQGFDEVDEKGVYLGEIGKKYCNLSFLSISKRRHIIEKIDITGLDNSNEICRRILGLLAEKYADFSENLYKIQLIGTVSADFTPDTDEITARLSQSLYFAKVNDKTEPEINFEELAKEISLKGIFVKNMLEKIGNAEQDEIPMLKNALKFGLRAFNSEVNFDED